MKKFTNKKGFTIMEMLIVVAIIAVLVAIAIPTFSGSLTKAKEAADVANLRAAYAEVQVKALEDTTGTYTIDENAVCKVLLDDDTSTENDIQNCTDALNYPTKADFTAATGSGASATPATLTYGKCEKLKTASGGDTYTWTF